MGIASKVLFGAAATSNGGTTVFTHSFGDDPKAAIFVLSGAVAFDTPAAHARFSMGFFDGTNACAFGVVDQDAVTDTSSNRSLYIRSDAHSIVCPNVGTTTSFSATASWTDTTCTLTWGTAPAVAFKVMCIVLTGTDLTAFVGTFACPLTLNTSAATTDPGFQLDQLIGFACTDNDFLTFDETVHPTMRFNLTMVDYNGSTIKQRSLGMASESSTFGAGTQVGQYFSTMYAVKNLLGWPEVPLNAAEMTAVSSTGFTLTSRITQTAGPQSMGYLALRYSGGEHDILDFSYKTSVGSQTHTGFGWEPAFLMALEGWVPNFNTWYSSGDGSSIAVGFANIAEQGSAGIAALDNINTPTDTYSRMDDTRFVSVGNTNMTAPVKGEVTSLDADGFTVDFTAISGTTRRFSVLAFKEPIDENHELTIGAGVSMPVAPGGAWGIDTSTNDLVAPNQVNMPITVGIGVAIGQAPPNWGNNALGFRFSQPLATSSSYLYGGPHDMVLRVTFSAARSAEIYNVISQNADRTPATTPHSMDLFAADGTTHLDWHLISVSPTSITVEFRHPTWTVSSYGFTTYFGYNLEGVSFENRAQCYTQHYGVYKLEETLA